MRGGMEYRGRGEFRGGRGGPYRGRGEFRGRGYNFYRGGDMPYRGGRGRAFRAPGDFGNERRSESGERPHTKVYAPYRRYNDEPEELRFWTEEAEQVYGQGPYRGRGNRGRGGDHRM